MASSQIEFASNSPFGYVLKERNRHDHLCRTRDSNAFQKNFKDLVQNHLTSCISGHSRNSSCGFIDCADLWVHNPQPVNNHSLSSGDVTMSGHSDPNQNSHLHIDYTDLWVHDPQRNNENNPKKTKGGEKWDKARDMVLASERKIQESSAGLVKNQNNASSGPVKNQESSAGLAKNQSSAVLVKNKGNASSGVVKNQESSEGLAKNQGSVASGLVKNQGNASSGPASSSQRGKIPDNSSSVPVSTSQRGRHKEGGASSEAVVTSNRERSPEGSASGPVPISRRGSNWEVVSSRLLPSSGPAVSSQRDKIPDNPASVPVSTSQRGRHQEGASSAAVLTSSNNRERSPDSSASRPVPMSRSGRIWEIVSSRLLPSSGPAVSSQRGKIPDNSSSVPVPASQRGRHQEGPSSETVLASHWERRPDGSAASGPVPISRGGRNWEVVSSRLLPSSQKRKSQEEEASWHDSRSQREKSPAQSESSVELPCSRGVSSLVRRWKDFEAESKILVATNSSVCSTSRCNSVMCSTDNESFADAPGRGSDGGEEFVDLRPTTPTKGEDLFFDWESDQTGLSGPPSVRGRNSDATESEKIRVADIIKKLSSNGECHNDRESSTASHESLPRLRTSLDKSELRPFSPVASSPRIIRGRQAFSDFLIQMERDRQKELEGLTDSKAVSKFSYRGRIQAMLRLRFLRRKVEEKDDRRAISTSSESSRLAQSTISHIRQRFSENSVQHKETDSRSQQGEEMIDKAPQGKKVSVISQQTKENHQQQLTEPRKPPKVLDNNLDAQKAIRNAVVDFNHQEQPITVKQQNDLPQQQSEISREEEDSTSSGVNQQETKSEFSSNHEKEECKLKETSVKISLGTEQPEMEESNNQSCIGSSNEFLNGTAAEVQVINMEEENFHQNVLVTEYVQETDVCQPFEGWDELQEDDQQEESNQDWICDVSRPRSTWEDLRQARYQEMLDPFVDNSDIRELLNRKSVSSFLSSGLRDNIDRLMMYRAQQSPKALLIRRVEKEERTDQLVEEKEEAQAVEMKEQEETEFGEEAHEEEAEKQQLSRTNGYENEEEDEIQSEPECMESHYAAQSATWGNSEDHYFVSASFPGPHESHSSGSSSPETHPSPSTMEMQFMYEMKGNMEQLHQEISRLRRSVKSCISMQMKLQKVVALEALSSCHSAGRKKRRDSSASKKSSRGRCCVCYEMQIDSLLYRCGHMCTCFKCAQDLQWSSGKCPICEAPINDVVRAYACS